MGFRGMGLEGVMHGVGVRGMGLECVMGIPGVGLE